MVPHVMNNLLAGLSGHMVVYLLDVEIRDRYLVAPTLRGGGQKGGSESRTCGVLDERRGDQECSR